MGRSGERRCRGKRARPPYKNATLRLNLTRPIEPHPYSAISRISGIFGAAREAIRRNRKVLRCYALASDPRDIFDKFVGKGQLFPRRAAGHDPGRSDGGSKAICMALARESMWCGLGNQQQIDVSAGLVIQVLHVRTANTFPRAPTLEAAISARTPHLHQHREPSCPPLHELKIPTRHVVHSFRYS
jgi:hypothetical protein